ncbi:cell division protein ZapA [Neiella sp. HB171785]|uniref:Cell division protein ZapA n=1 Tax=Neiella litorisoli TaxID=2771431 RepID=A0A8J6QUA8_9GAMM|nr:cell division protein ZapA [Neiella litorisoli]MBD1388753.1 cell division protein ZapA [Neiella litorisoli]
MSDQEIEVKLLGKTYTLRCPSDELDDLKLAADLLEQKVAQLQGNKASQSTEQVALMAALNLCHELLIEQRRSEQYAKSMDSRMRMLQATVERALNEGNKRVDKAPQDPNN